MNDKVMAKCHAPRMTELDARINNQSSRIGDLRRQLRQAEECLYTLLVERAGVKVGDVVRGTGPISGKEFIVRRLDRGGAGSLWVVGSPRRRDGTFGTATRQLFTDWELAKAGEES